MFLKKFLRPLSALPVMLNKLKFSISFILDFIILYLELKGYRNSKNTKNFCNYTSKILYLFLCLTFIIFLCERYIIEQKSIVKKHNTFIDRIKSLITSKDKAVVSKKIVYFKLFKTIIEYSTIIISLVDIMYVTYICYYYPLEEPVEEELDNLEESFNE
jgi:hypothetical protein